MHSVATCSSILLSLLLLVSIPLSSAHGVITGAKGDMGGSGFALGVDTSTPRNGTRRRPFQQDTTRFRGQGRGATATGCGQTLQLGPINIPQALEAVIKENGGLPLVSAGGTLTMTLHQINADGAGPFACMIDMTGTGASFTPLTVTQNVPGRGGRDKSGQKTDHPLVVQLPTNLKCTGTGSGGKKGICMVRCQNPVGPFGGCVPVQQVTAKTGKEPPTQGGKQPNNPRSTHRVPSRRQLDSPQESDDDDIEEAEAAN